MKKVQLGYLPTKITREPNELGESIEEMIRRSIANKTPIEGNAPLIYTERKDGVRAEFNCRTDRFEVAREATDKFSRSIRARAANGIEDPFAKPQEVPNNDTPKTA